MAGLEQLPIENLYKNIPNAVEWFERGSGGPFSQALMDVFWSDVRAQGMSVSDFITNSRVGLRYAIVFTGLERFSAALKEIDHPEFRQYVTAKLGQM